MKNHAAHWFLPLFGGIGTFGYIWKREDDFTDLPVGFNNDIKKPATDWVIIQEEHF